MGDARESADIIADEVEAGRYSPNENRTQEKADEMIVNKATLWAAVALNAWHSGVAIENRSNLLVWNLGNTEKKWADCLRLDGQIHTGEAWQESGYMPKAQILECTGFYCDCSLDPAPDGAVETGGF